MFRPQDPESFIPNAPVVWGPQPYKGHIFVADHHSGLWAVKLVGPEPVNLGEPQQEGPATARPCRERPAAAK